MAQNLNIVRDDQKNFRQLVILVLLYLIPASQALLPIDDPDIWWHLRTGQWIIEHHMVPTTDPSLESITVAVGATWLKT